MVRIVSIAVCIGGIIAIGLAAGASFGVDASDKGYEVEKNSRDLSAECVHDCLHGGPSNDILWNSSFEETLSPDEWFVEDGYLKTPLCDANGSHFTFGEEGWSNYEFRVQACAVKGASELMIGVRYGLKAGYRLVLGAGGNRRHELLRVANDGIMRKEDTTLIESASGYIGYGRCHRIRIRCEGERLGVWLDNMLLFDVTDNGGPLKGRVSLGVRGGQALFRNLRINGLDGKALFRGLPMQAGHWLAVGRGEVTLDNKGALNRKRSVKIVSDAASTGIEQECGSVREGLWRGTLWVRGDAPEGVSVRLRDAKGILMEKKLAVPSSDWRGLPFDLALDRVVEDARLQIVANGKATVWIDQVQLFPDPADNGGSLAAGQ